MDNQDQFNETPEVVQEQAQSEFSTRRRVATAVLVLVAALLLGYVIYMMSLSTQQPTNAPTPIGQPEVTVDQQAQTQQRLQNFEQESANEQLSASTSQQLEVFTQSEAPAATPEQLNRLEQFENEN